MYKTKNKYSDLFAICKKQSINYKDLVFDFTGGQHESLSKLTDGEYHELLTQLKRKSFVPDGDAQRKKMIAIAMQMRRGETTTEAVKWLNEWSLQQKFKKPLMQHTAIELNTLVFVLEHHVLPSFLKSI